MNNNIVIDFKYKLNKSDTWLKKDITVEEYFDLDYLDEGEPIVVDSVPLYNDFIDYIKNTDCEKQQISKISIDIIDTVTNCKLHFYQTFWNKQENWIVERIDTIDGNEINYHEFIISTVLPREISNNTELDYEIIRFQKKESDINFLFHSIIRDNADGSQSEILM